MAEFESIKGGQTHQVQEAQVLDLLVQSCPSFEPIRAEHVAEHGNELLYVAAGAFARHLLDLHQNGDVHSLVQVGRSIEHLHTHGTPGVQELATIGILESIQNVWFNNGADPEAFAQYLGPQGRAWWQGLRNFWSGQAPIVRGEA